MDTCPAWMLEPRDSEKRDTGPSEASPRETGRASVLSLILVWAGRERAAHQAPPPCPSFQLQAQRDVQGRLCPAPLLLTWPSTWRHPRRTVVHPPASSPFINPPKNLSWGNQEPGGDQGAGHSHAGSAGWSGRASPTLCAHRRLPLRMIQVSTMHIGPALLSVNYPPIIPCAN